MAQFDGSFKKEQRVSLAGRSRTEETRAQVLERTRRERERRLQEKLEHKSSAAIQAAWRGWRARQLHRAEVRQAWLERYGPRAERALPSDLSPDSGFLRQLCYFASMDDVQLLASVCRGAVALQPAAAAGAGMASMGSPVLLLCMHAAAGRQQAAAVMHQAQKLAALCLSALARHAPQLGTSLQQPRLGLAAAMSADGPVPPIVECLLLLLSPESWREAVGAAAAEATARLLAGLTSAGMFRQLVDIAAAACPEDNAAGAMVQRQNIPCGEALVTALTVRFLSLHQAIASRPLMQAGQPPERQLSLLLTLPLLHQRLPTLQPVAVRLWRHAVGALHALPAADLQTWLELGCRPSWPGATGSAALAGAALLGNLLAGGAAAMTADDARQLAAARQPALHFAGLASNLLRLLPERPFFCVSSSSQASSGAGQWADDDETEDPTAPAMPAAKLPWGVERLLPSKLAAQLQLVSNGSLLRALVGAILPFIADGDSSGHQRRQLDQQRAVDARRLCALLQQLVALAGHSQRVLVMLAFSADFVQRLWFSYLQPAQLTAGEGWVPSGDAACDPGWMLPITIFSLTYSAFIITAGDDELYEAQRPLPLSELYSEHGNGGVLNLLKMALWHVLWTEAAPSPGGWSLEAAALRLQLKQAAGKLMGQLHDWNCRRAFAPAKAFQADALQADRFQAEIQAGTAHGQDYSEGGTGRAWGLLSSAPYLVPFRERAKLFQVVVAQERARYRDMEAIHFGGANRFVPIRRTQVLQDAFDKMSGLGDGLHGRIRIQFIDAHGLEEAGVDGGGIFKEFIEAVLREGFDPNLGLFKATTDNRLYPNPHAKLVVGNALRLIEFLGKMLGKAMYEGILVELPLAPFFLKGFRGAYCDINDLPTLDLELHRNLVFLKRYEGNVEDLGLTFTITDNVLGRANEIELAPNGRNVAVTSDNRLSYIHRVADYRLNRQIREPAAAFLRGLQELIQPEWVRMLNEEELQMLISGGQQGLDIADMQANVQYSGGYHEDHPVIREFWDALATFTPQEQADFLRFVTSCPRPPLLGFRYLEPPLCIQLAGSMLDERAVDRLPTAATCINLLKLPPYRTAQHIRNKLLYAVESGAGFELS